MNNKYRYRNHIKYLKNIILLTLIIVFPVFFFPLWLLGTKDGNTTIIIFILILSLINVIFAIVISKVLERLTKVEIIIGDEYITYTNYKGDTIIKYEDIYRLEFPSIKYTGGWVKIISKNNNIRLTVVVKDIHKLLLDLKEQLDKREFYDRYNSKKLFNFLKTATYSDDSWDRLYRYWWKLILLSIITALIGVGTELLLQYDNFFVLTKVSFAFPIIIYLITEIKFCKRIANLSDEENLTVPKPDLEYEKSILKRYLCDGIVLFIVFIIAVSILTYI
ncbi:MAG: hypothetical protein ACLFMO_05095 [Eubacteriales bacterium]